jgi:hypothetical protein
VRRHDLVYAALLPPFALKKSCVWQQYPDDPEYSKAHVDQSDQFQAFDQALGSAKFKIHRFRGDYIRSFATEELTEEA